MLYFFTPKCTKMRLAAEFHPDPLGSLQRFPGPSCIKGEGEEERGGKVEMGGRGKWRGEGRGKGKGGPPMSEVR